MPIYEYQCPQCGKFELVQKVNDRVLTRCPTCKGKVSKLISNTSFQLKGSGWYATDYARKTSTAAPANETKANGSDDSGTSDAAATKTDATAKKKEAKTKDAAPAN